MKVTCPEHFDALEIPVLGVTVAGGEEIDVPAEIGRSLVAQGWWEHGERPTDSDPGIQLADDGREMSALKVAELRQVAAERGIDVPKSASKKALLEALAPQDLSGSVPPKES